MFLKWADIIQAVLYELNSKLSEDEAPFAFDSSDQAIENLYELCLPDDEDTGEPDEDLPSFNKEQMVSDLGETTLTLLVKEPKKAIKHNKVETTTIQSVIDSTYNSIIEKQTSTSVYVDKNASINVQSNLEVSAESSQSTPLVASREKGHSSSGIWWNCTIF